jgi:hypothetical protein
MLLLFGLAASAMAGALVGVDYVPSGLGDQAWVAEEQLSGTGVAERDGLLVPPLRSFGGGVWGRNGILCGLSMARISTTTTTASVGTRSVRMAVRPALDYRRWLMDPKPGKALAYLTAGLHGVVPFAQEVADDPGDEERVALEEAAKADRSRIGTVGAQLGLGAEIRLENGLGVGMKTVLVAHRAQASDDQTQTVSSMIRPETSLSISVWF